MNNIKTNFAIYFIISIIIIISRKRFKKRNKVQSGNQGLINELSKFRDGKFNWKESSKLVFASNRGFS